MILSRFQKPSRYIDSEYNVIKHAQTGSSLCAGMPLARRVRCALAFPDIYDVGMSHQGLRILYDVVNSLPHASAERVFSPWIDLEAHMKESGIPLSSLETHTPLHQFDIAGFSLQYELSYTTVLNMLHMGGIPLRSEERLQSRKALPLIIAGGPCTVNPAPLSPFIDAFLIGDGEEAIVRLIETVHQWKLAGDGDRSSVLREIARLDGFYVPSHHDVACRVKRQFVADLDSAPYPVKPVVPYTSIVHDRVTIEVSRGCTRGCRFCQAGMIYRPLRERSPEKVLAIAEESLRNTGHDEVSLTSLSAGDYSCLLPVVRTFNQRYGASKIALSLPSLRVGSINREVLREIRSVRKTGFTMAPEAATERLRSVINKDFTAEEYERALKTLFAEGWLGLKLYFMIGLPTERDEDIDAIKEMITDALRIAKKNTGKFITINTTISPFVPKAHTPFQWYGQLGLDEMRRKLRYLREELSGRKFKYKGHDERMSFLEAVFARGDERLAALLEKACEEGCRLDGWSEVFDFDKWLSAMDKTGIDGAAYAGRTFSVDERLPWDVVDIGVGKEFLYKEYERAIGAERTKDCKELCIGCGLACKKAPESRNARASAYTEIKETGAPMPPHGKVRVRARFSKGGMLRYLSHLELSTAVLRTLRRAGVRFDFSKGFHPSPKISFGPSLSVGVAGEREYFDMEVFTPFDIEFYINELRALMPEGMALKTMSLVPVNEPSLSSFISRYDYTVSIGSELQPAVSEAVAAARAALSGGGPLIVKRDDKEVDIARCIEHVEISGAPDGAGNSIIMMTVKDYDSVKARVKEIVEAITGVSPDAIIITRTAMYGWKGGWVEPL